MQDDSGAYVRAFERPDGVELCLREFLLHSGVTARGAVVLVHGAFVYSAVLQPFIDHLLKNGTNSQTIVRQICCTTIFEFYSLFMLRFLCAVRRSGHL